jgi:hypothetical protein
MISLQANNLMVVGSNHSAALIALMASHLRGFFVLGFAVSCVRFRHAKEACALIKFALLCISALGLFVPMSIEACSMDPPSSRAEFEQLQNKYRAGKLQYNLAIQTRWWREATEVQLVEIVGLSERRARLVRPVGWLKGRGTARTLEVFDENHYDPCPPHAGPLSISRRGDLFIVFVLPRPIPMSFEYQQVAVDDIAIPELSNALARFKARGRDAK